MTYKEVFQLAQDKGYKLFFDWKEAMEQGDQDEIFIINPELTLSELTLIQKWLREEHQLDITPKKQVIYPDFPDKRQRGYGGHIDNLKEPTKVLRMEVSTMYLSMGDYFGTTYEEALLNGVHEALKLLS